MVKSVVGEESRLQPAEERLFQSAVRAQVGLVIGRLSPALDRGFVYDLVPTPPTDAGLPPCSLPDAGDAADKKKGSKGGGGGRSSQPEAAAAALCIDADWVAEHARQVSRMLLGGMHVVGIYVWASEGSFKASNLVLWQTVKGVAQAAPFYDGDPPKRLIIHASYSPRRWTCRNCLLTSNNVSASLQPCDFKMGKVLASLQTFRCMYRFDMRLPIVGESNPDAFKDVIRDAIANHAKELKVGAKALMDGKLVTKDLQYSSRGIHEVELLLPLMNNMHSEASRLGEVVGLVVFRGVICASAYMGPKDSISDAVSEIKGDIISSLQSRLDIISEEAEGRMDSLVNNSIEGGKDSSAETVNCHLILYNLKKNCTLLFPRRVLVPWLADVFICDYLQPSETFEDVKDHCKEMMSMEAQINDESILEVEKEAASMKIKTFWDAVLRKPAPLANPLDNASAERKTVTAALKGSNLIILIAIAVLMISVLVGWAFTRK